MKDGVFIKKGIDVREKPRDFRWVTTDSLACKESWKAEHCGSCKKGGKSYGKGSKKGKRFG